MSDTEETSTLLDRMSDSGQSEDLESVTVTAATSANHNRKSRAKSPKKPSKNNSSCLCEKALFMCPSRWIILVAIAVLVILYLFTTFEVSFVDQQRWVPQAHLQQHQKEELNSLSSKYDSEFNSRVVAPFRDLLNRLTGKIDAVSGNLSSILPKRIQLDDSQTMALIERERSNIAAIYYDRWKQRGFGANAVKYPSVKYCSQVNMVSPHLLKSNNLFWQVVHTGNMTVYLYNAYYDNRLWGKPQVKIISVTDKQIPVEKTKWWCLLWFENLADPVLAPVEEWYTIWPEYWSFGVENGIFGPQIASCSIPKEYASQVPQAVSLQSVGECENMDKYPTNVLRVAHNLREKPTNKAGSSKKSFGVCVQAFRFGSYDVSVRLVEWLEMVRILGADKVYFYVYGATGNLMKVVRHYAKEGLVDWRNLTLPGEQININAFYNYYYSQLGGKFWPQELLELNDCLYRNIYRHDYVVIIDIDEIPMPQKLGNWHELVNKIENGLSESDLKKKGYYLNRHSYVYEMFEETEIAETANSPGKPIPDWLYIMRHTYRADLLGAGSNIKCFHRTDLVTAVHNHFPMRCINTTGHHSCDGLEIDPSDSILKHYRRNRSPPKDCNTPKSPKNCTIHDRTAWRFFDELQAKVRPQLVAIFGNGNEEK